MKRDMEVVRRLLLWMEEQKEGIFSYIDVPPMPTFDTVEHMKVLESGGYLVETRKGCFRVTWEGHEFLDKVRDEDFV